MGRTERRTYAQRAAEIAMLAGVWLIGSGILIGLGPLAWSGGTQRLGVHFPQWPLILMNVMGGFVAAAMCAARAFNHQPGALCWVAAIVGAVVVATPVLTGAPTYLLLHNALAGTALCVAAVVSAFMVPGALSAPRDPDWALPEPKKVRTAVR